MFKNNFEAVCKYHYRNHKPSKIRTRYSWFATTWQGSHVGSQYNRIISWTIYIKSQRSTCFHISNRPLPFHLHLQEISTFLDSERCFSSWLSTWPPWRHVQTNNRSFPSSPGPLYQNEVKCSAFDMEMIFHSHANKTHFHKKGCALSLILKVRVFGARKWPIPESYLCPLSSSLFKLPLCPPLQPLLISFCSRKALGELSYVSSAVFNHTLIQSVVTTAMSWHAYPSGQSPYKPTNWQRCLPSEAIRSCIR